MNKDLGKKIQISVRNRLKTPVIGFLNAYFLSKVSMNHFKDHILFWNWCHSSEKYLETRNLPRNSSF